MNNRALQICVCLILLVIWRFNAVADSFTVKHIEFSDIDLVPDTRLGPPDSIFWINDKRFITAGLKKAELATAKTLRHVSAWVTIVDTDGTLEYVSKERGALIYCAGLGQYYIQLSKKRLTDLETETQVRRGTNGNETTSTFVRRFDPDLPTTAIGGRFEFDCSRHVDLTLAEYRWSSLLEADGELIYYKIAEKKAGRRDKEKFISWRSPKTKKITKTKLPQYLYGERIRYSPDSKIYYLWSLKRRDPVCRSIWVFSPHSDNQVEQICLPNGKWNAGTLEIAALKSGWFISNLRGAGSAAYLYQNKKMNKIIDGYVLKMDGSEDGCKIAFVHEERGNHSRLNLGNLDNVAKLRIADFCETN